MVGDFHRVLWFSATSKTDHYACTHDITELLLEVALNTINLTLTVKPGDSVCNIQYEYFPSRGRQCIFISISKSNASLIY
jgi:hypothetical protein